MILILFILTCIFAIGMKLNIMQTLYFLLALTTTVYIFKFVFEYKYLDGQGNYSVWSLILSVISLLVALVVFGSNKIQDAWLIYIIYLVLIFSCFHLFGF